MDGVMDDMADLVEKISAASHEQAQGIEQVNIAVSEMDKVVQANAAATEQLTAESEELNGLVGILISIVEGDITGGMATSLITRL